MFSKFIAFRSRRLSLILLGLVCSTLFLPACSQEEADYYDIPKVQLKGASCFSKITNDVEKYFEGNATEKDVEQIWNCFNRSLTAFSEYVDGEDKGVYKATDLRVFLEKYFLNTAADIKRGKVRRISDAFLEETMEIKRLFLGGQRASLTKKEITDSLHLIEEFRRISRELLPYTRLLFKKRKDIPPPHQFREAEAALEKAFREMMGLIAKNAAEYDLPRLEVLINEMTEYFKVDNPDTSLAKVAKYLPALFEFKAVLLYSSNEKIERGEWQDVGSVAGRLFTLVLRSSTYFSSKSLLDYSQMQGFSSILTDGLKMLRESADRRPVATISNEEIKKLIDKLAIAEALPFGFSAETAGQLWVRITDHILNPQNIHPTSGISLPKLAYVENELNIWSRIQNALIFGEDMGAQDTLKEMQEILATPWPIRLDILGRVIIDGDMTAKPDLESATRLNWARALFKLLFQTYVTDKNRRIEKKMSTKELRMAFLDIKPVLVGMGLIQESSDDFDSRLFRDANLFMPRSDGDKFLSFFEAVEYLHFIYAGIDAGKQLISGLLDSCRVDEERVQVKCFREVFQSEYVDLLAHLPLYQKYARRLSNKKWAKDIRAIENINRDGGASNEPIFTSDIYESFIALQYIETLFLRFDEDQSGDLSIKEVLKALKHFRNVLGDLFGLETDEEFEQMEAVFTYMFKYGEFPDPEDPLAETRLNNWKWDKENWKLAADRGIVLQILAAISRR